MHDAVARVRRFNRLLTQRIGLLDERYLGSALPFAQARLLYEVAVLYENDPDLAGAAKQAKALVEQIDAKLEKK